MEELNLKELFDYVKERIYIVIGIIAFVLAVGCVYSMFLKTPMYQSTTTILLVNDDGTSSSNTGSITTSDIQLSRNLVSTYSELIRSRRIADQVVESLGLEYSSESLIKKINVTSANNTEVIKVSVSDKDKALAADIANEVVKVFSEEIKSFYKLQNVSVVDVAEEASAPYNTNLIKDLVIYVFIGVVLALGTVFVIYYFDTTIKNAEEIENKLGLPVIGIVPKVKFKDK